jgi:hypothetical protein
MTEQEDNYELTVGCTVILQDTTKLWTFPKAQRVIHVNAEEFYSVPLESGDNPTVCFRREPVVPPRYKILTVLPARPEDQPEEFAKFVYLGYLKEGKVCEPRLTRQYCSDGGLSCQLWEYNGNSPTCRYWIPEITQSVDFMAFREVDWRLPAIPEGLPDIPEDKEVYEKLLERYSVVLADRDRLKEELADLREEYKSLRDDLYHRLTEY